MDVSILGVTGGVDSSLPRKLRSRGDALRELVRRDDQRAELAKQGVDARLGDLPSMTMEELGETFRGVDAIVFSAGSNGSSTEVTRAIDSDGVTKAIEPARLAGVERIAQVSVLAESRRGHALGEEVEHYFAVKKVADTLSRSGLNWLIPPLAAPRRSGNRHRLPGVGGVPRPDHSRRRARHPRRTAARASSRPADPRTRRAPHTDRGGGPGQCRAVTSAMSRAAADRSAKSPTRVPADRPGWR